MDVTQFIEPMRYIVRMMVSLRKNGIIFLEEFVLICYSNDFIMYISSLLEIIMVKKV